MFFRGIQFVTKKKTAKKTSARNLPPQQSNTTFSLSAHQVLPLIGALLAGFVVYQSQTFIVLSDAAQMLHLSGSITRVLLTALVVALCLGRRTPIWVSAIACGAAVLLGSTAILVGVEYPEIIFGENLLELKILVESIAGATLAALFAYVTSLIKNQRVFTYGSLVVVLLIFALHFGLIINKAYTGDPFAREVLTGTQELSINGYDGFDYAETIRRMNKGESYYEAYTNAWASDPRMEQPFNSVFFFRPAGMPTLLASLPGTSLLSVLMWWVVLVEIAGFAAFMFLRKFTLDGFALAGTILILTYYLVVGCTVLSRFDWLMAEVLVSLTLICALAALVYKRWWLSCILLLLATMTREFAVVFIPIWFLVWFFEPRDKKIKLLIPLGAMLAGVIGFYSYHIYTAPVADAGTGTKLNFIETWFKGNFAWYQNYLKYKIDYSWPLAKAALLLPISALIGSLSLQKNQWRISFAVLSAGLGAFFLLLGQNEWQNYWGPFGVPILILLSVLVLNWIDKKDRDEQEVS